VQAGIVAAIRTISTSPTGLSILGLTWHPEGHSLAITTVAFGDPGNSRLLSVNEDATGVAVPLFDHIGPSDGSTIFPPASKEAPCCGTIRSSL
jgi:hypothetical protein